MNKKPFGMTSAGEAFVYEISNGKGMRAAITDFGASLVSLWVPDKDGNEVDVVLGYDDAAAYEERDCFFGATVGRNANRIANACITIDGVEYHQEVNDNENNLHSGSHGTSERIWSVKAQSENSITFAIVSQDMEEGFPGTAQMEVTYTVTEDQGLKLDYQAAADKKTTFNMTNHSYFNLNGYNSGSVYDQELQLMASRYTPVIDRKSIPTGEIAPVAGTPFDFRKAKKIGKEIESDFVQMTYGQGYDHNFALDKTGKGVETAAIAFGPKTGIVMEVLTDLPGIQFYSANFIEGQVGKAGFRHHKREAFCLETQYFPNAINDPHFETPITDAGEKYQTTTIYRFSVK